MPVSFSQPLNMALSNNAPVSEGVSGAAGSVDEASRSDHVHKRLTSAANVTLDGSGLATTVFSRTFTTEPVLVFGSIGTGTDPVPDFRGELIKTGALWTGVTIYGQKNRVLPTVALPGGLVLLTSLITALNTIFTSLSGFAPYEAAAGARVSVTAIQASA